MNILITGATGLVGQKLIKKLIQNHKYNLKILSRDSVKAQAKLQYPFTFYEWDVKAGKIDPKAIEGTDIIIHLAGENIADGRWSKKKKKRILESRTVSTKLLMDTIKDVKNPPQKFISAAAIGIYGDQGNTLLTEESSQANSYLGKVCQEWEASVLNHGIKNLKSICLRTGIVLASEGGALQKMLPAFKAGIAGKLGSGRQFMSWVHIDDLIDQFLFCIESDLSYQVYNTTAPNPVTNKEFTKCLGRSLSRPTLLPAPALLLKLVLGEMSTILLSSQRVNSTRIQEEGYQFKYKDLKTALGDLLAHEVKGENTFAIDQWVTSSPEEVFDFFSSEKNLELITPPYLEFKVIGKDTKEIQKGTLIDYKLRLRGIPIKWKTHIKEFVRNKRFVDEQLKGPYSKWLHQHDFSPYKGGTLIQDRVIYKVPLGLLGRIVAGAYIRKDVSGIFKYRTEIIQDYFKKV